MSYYSDAVVTINEEDYTLAKRKFHCPAYYIYGVGVDLDRFCNVTLEEKNELREKYRLDKEDFVLIYAAELNANKNQSFLVKLMPEILKEIPNAKLLLAGYGELREYLEKLIADLNLQEKVQLLGYRKDIDKLYQLSDVGVSASVREGFGLNILEEMACGLPVVASENRGHKELIVNEENGFLIKGDNGKEFIEGIKKIYLSKQNRDMMSENNKAKAQKFSVANSVKQMAEIYKEVLK